VRPGTGTWAPAAEDPAESARRAEEAARDAADPRPLAERIAAQFPPGLEVKAAPEPGQPPVRLTFRIRNPGADLLVTRLRARPPWVRVEPESLPLEPGDSGAVTVEIDPGQVTRENHSYLQVVASWSALVTAE